MEIKKILEAQIYDMEKVARLFEIEPFDIYLLGGSACLLGDYTERGPRNFLMMAVNPFKIGKSSHIH